jgi:hypothetical protein
MSCNTTYLLYGELWYNLNVLIPSALTAHRDDHPNMPYELNADALDVLLYKMWGLWDKFLQRIENDLKSKGLIKQELSNAFEQKYY